MTSGNRGPRVGLVYHEDCLKHEEWPERPERLSAILEGLRQAGLMGRLIPVTPGSLPEAEIELVHCPDYVNSLRDFCARGGGLIAADTMVGPDSFRAAQLAAGGAVEAARLVLQSELDRVAVVVRPPGHHAVADQGMGFCLFNNVALAAAWARRRGGAERVAIVDWDMHHGNGTQEAFFLDPSVLFISLHEVPAYPGTGWYTEVGAGKGEGYTINIPMPPGAGDDCCHLDFESLIGPALEAFRPDLILVSAGQDGHVDDHMGNLRLTSGAFGWMAGFLVQVAVALGHGRVVVVLEGGYDLTSLADAWNRITAALLGDAADAAGTEGAADADGAAGADPGQASSLEIVRETVKERLAARALLPLPPGTLGRRPDDNAV